MPNLLALGRLFARGYLIVLITTINVGQIAAHHVFGGFITGGVLSWVWWENTHSAAHSDIPHARLAYALGAAFGNASGILFTVLINAHRS